MPDVLEQCKVRDATLVGFSMGSGEVARYLSRHSGKGVVSAALVSSVVPFMLKTDDNSNGIEVRGDDRGDEGGPGKVLHELLQGLFRSRPDLSSDQRRTGASNVDSGHASRSETDAGLRQGIRDNGLSAGIASFRCPTLIIHGTADKTVPIDAAHCLDELSVGRTPDRARLLAGALALHPPLDGHGEPEPARRRRRPGGPRRRRHAGPVRAQARRAPRCSLPSSTRRPSVSDIEVEDQDEAVDVATPITARPQFAPTAC